MDVTAYIGELVVQIVEVVARAPSRQIPRVDGHNVQEDRARGGGGGGGGGGEWRSSQGQQATAIAERIDELVADPIPGVQVALV